MALAAGTRLGPYEILAPLGTGGMGEVYRARDPRLGRDVAIKVLPADRLADPARRARFLQEARAASALSHPNIVTIHEIEQEGDLDFLVMEYVAGHSLDTSIPRQGMRLGEVLRIAIPVADALAAAHAAGIVHRDLKPANVMLMPDGTPKVLDFGLAKLLQRDSEPGERSTTVESHASPLSGVGTVAGTVGYMSPEQATGAVVDTRSDIFSFGALLYELVTGRRAFAGASSAETLAAILKEQPTPPREVAPDVPMELERILLRCLRKDPARRFQSMGDVKVELQEIKEESDSAAAAAAPVVRGTRRRRWLALAAVGVLLLVVATAVTLWRVRARPREGPAPRIVQLTSEPFVRTAGSFSPDGTQLAYAAPDNAGHRAIWIRIVGQPEARRLTTGATVDGYPAWSPDGKQIAFVRTAPPAGAGVYLVSPLGGAERRLADFPVRYQVSWSPDSRWLAVGKWPPKDPIGAAIQLIPTTGGETRQVTFPTPHVFHVAPGISPDGAALAYFSCEGPLGVRVCDVWVVSLDSQAHPQGQPRRLTHHGIPNGGLTWTRDGQWIVYSSYTHSFSRLYRVRPDASAQPEQVELAGLNASFPFASRDADRLGYLSEDDNGDLWRLDLGGGATPLVVSTFVEYNPQHSPDGRRLAFSSNRTDERFEVWLGDADGSNVTRLTRGPGRAQGSPRWSPDGRTIAFDSQGADGHFDIWTIGVDGSGLRQVTRHPADENMPSWSRDGRFIYYGSNRTGRYEIWRVPPGGVTEEQVTHGGGFSPFESLDGRMLYYLREDPNTTSAGSGLVARPTAGGPERLIVECVDLGFGWGVGPRGVFHVDCRMPGVPDGALRVLRHWEAATGKDHEVTRVDCGLPPNLGLSASPDGRHLVFTRLESASNLMMIENFR